MFRYKEEEFGFSSMQGRKSNTTTTMKAEMKEVTQRSTLESQERELILKANYREIGASLGLDLHIVETCTPN